ncbi:unnamed protein product [Rhizophagus irregularis]|nr:unnamed protein product [Rhizophagus irregularis]CAB4418507.1 unnamed protein product [Rhizophagus irregularis]
MGVNKKQLTESIHSIMETMNFDVGNYHILRGKTSNQLISDHSLSSEQTSDRPSISDHPSSGQASDHSQAFKQTASELKSNCHN